MTNSKFWPSKAQLSLLKACTLSGVEAEEHFHAWKSSLNLSTQKSGEQLLALVFDQIDHGSQRLLPLLHYNLSETLTAEPIIKSIKGYNRYVWSKNQIIFFQVGKVIDVLTENNIQHFFVKGVPLAKLYYSFDGIRPMSDLDIVIREKDLTSAWDKLSTAGWKDKFSEKSVDYKKLIVRSRCLVNFKDDELDLHWRTFKDSFQESDEEEIWSGLIDFKVGNHTAYTLSPTHQLIHTLIHGMQWNEVPSFRWICDSLIILKQTEIDWPLLLKFAKKRKYTLRLSCGFQYLKDEFKANIPEEVLQELQTFQVSSAERKFFNLLVKKHEPGSLSHILMRHYQFKLYYNNSNIFKEIWIFLNNYRANWGSKNLLDAAFQVIGQMIGIVKHPYKKL
ncbi:MAG: nucleotidyltransferase family protein [Reichenbachiella sp.]|uniref:nucleotidyltransferase family protein n=1 Tax=Reichenbachiella sp. TaxID=2184521 RepID=UPI003265C79F